jgi:hypothetical protein
MASACRALTIRNRAVEAGRLHVGLGEDRPAAAHHRQDQAGWEQAVQALAPGPCRWLRLLMLSSTSRPPGVSTQWNSPRTEGICANGMRSSR